MKLRRSLLNFDQFRKLIGTIKLSKFLDNYRLLSIFFSHLFREKNRLKGQSHGYDRVNYYVVQFVAQQNLPRMIIAPE